MFEAAEVFAALSVNASMNAQSWGLDVDESCDISCTLLLCELLGE